MQKKIDVLISEEKIRKRIQEIGKKINQDYAGKELTIVGVLKGSFIFIADLARQIQVPLVCEFISVSSYGNEKKTSGEVKLNLDIASPLEGKHILIVEDIVDSGLTLNFLMELMQVRNPASIRTCTLLQKPECLKTNVSIDYVGFEIANHFVVGFGMDYAQSLRELPYIGIIKG